jgi:hypothetical protein
MEWLLMDGVVIGVAVVFVVFVVTVVAVVLLETVIVRSLQASL